MARLTRGNNRPVSLTAGTSDIFKKKWPRLFMIVTIAQTILGIVFEAYTFDKFNASLDETAKDSTSTDVVAQLKTIPTFLSLFIFGFLYELLLVWDALRLKNTIQIIGICVANLALLVYAGLQITQIQEAITIIKTINGLQEVDIWSEVKPFLIAVPCIVAFVTLLQGLIAWKLYQEFAWDILKQIGADYRMKKRYLHYQIYIALLKFDFFFFIGFTVQFLVVVGGKTDIEFALTTAAIPVTIGILLVAAWSTRREWRVGVLCILVLYLGGLAYFIFKLSRIYDPSHAADYKPVRRSLTAFTVFCILLLLMTITNAMVCMLNFGHGLKHHLNSAPDAVKDQGSYSMTDVKQPQLPSRMTID